MALQEARRNRSTARTNINAHRSHSVLTVRLQPVSGGAPSVLHLVDLAGAATHRNAHDSMRSPMIDSDNTYFRGSGGRVLLLRQQCCRKLSPCQSAHEIQRLASLQELSNLAQHLQVLSAWPSGQGGGAAAEGGAEHQPLAVGARRCHSLAAAGRRPHPLPQLQAHPGAACRSSPHVTVCATLHPSICWACNTINRDHRPVPRTAVTT